MKKNSPDESELIQFKRIYTTYAIPLMVYAAKFVDNDTAEDIVQDIFTKIWYKKSFLFFHENIKNYLYRSVRHACLDYLKHVDIKEDYAQATIRRLKIEEIYFNDDPQFLFQEDERINNIYKQIENLPEKCKEIFIMSYIEERKTDDIASLLNISKRTVESQLYKALRYLRNACLIIVLVIIFFYT